MPIYDNNFSNQEDFIDCINRGCEVEFIYKNKSYGIAQTPNGFAIYEAYNEESEKNYKSAKEMLQYPIGDKKLSDILNEMKITFRTF